MNISKQRLQIGLFCLMVVSVSISGYARAEEPVSPAPVPAVEAPVQTMETIETTPPPQTPPGVDILPAKSLSTDQLSSINPNAPTHPEVRLTPDKSEILKLDAEASTVIVGNPAHVSILVENTKTLVLVPKAEGATYFTVLDANGAVIMQRHVIVASPAEPSAKPTPSSTARKSAWPRLVESSLKPSTASARYFCTGKSGFEGMSSTWPPFRRTRLRVTSPSAIR